MEYFYLSRAGAVWVREGHPRQLHQPQHAARPQRLPGEAEALKYCQQYDVDGQGGGQGDPGDCPGQHPA